MSEKDFERVAEELSALVDGEVSELELRRVLKSIEQDPSLGDRWYRYQVTSAVLQRQSVLGYGQTQMASLSDQVKRVIAEEPALTGVGNGSARTARWGGLLKPVASLAVAASVSALVVLTWQSGGQQGVDAQPAVASAASSGVPAVLRARSGPLMTVSQGNVADSAAVGFKQPEIIRASSESQQRLNYYLMSHSSGAAFSTATGLAPQARAVSAQAPLHPGVSQAVLER